MKPGDSSIPWSGTITRYCFNPRPAMKPGDSQYDNTLGKMLELFQSTPGYEAGRFLGHLAQAKATIRVSIHARL